MNAKAKGSNAERELIHLLWERGWYPIRVAGSGSSKYPSPDIMAANGLRRLSIECKTSADPKRYITKAQISELREFSQKFISEPYVAFKHNAQWFFLGLDELADTGKNLLVSEELVKMKGLSLDELAGSKIKLDKVYKTESPPISDELRRN